MQGSVCHDCGTVSVPAQTECSHCFGPCNSFEPHSDSSGMQSQDAKPEACIYDEGGLTYGPWCYTHDKPYPHAGGHSG
jgi:hypothetical protein